ncbi:MAG: sugar phosphate isomerase/epimerase family protein [archaeon]
MKFGAMNSPFENVLDEMKSVASMGFDYMELTIEKPHSSVDILSSLKKEIISLARSYEISLLGHIPQSFDLGPPYYIQLTSASEEFVQRIEKAIQLARELDIDLISMHPPMLRRDHEVDERRILRQYIVAASQLITQAEDAGCTISIENMDEESFTNEDFEELFKRVPGLGFTLDIGHANIGKLTNSSVSYLVQFGERLRHVHVSDNLGGYGDLHLPVGAGIIQFDKIFNVIRGMQYDRTMTLEVFSPDRTYLRMSRDKIAEVLGTRPFNSQVPEGGKVAQP